MAPKISEVHQEEKLAGNDEAGSAAKRRRWTTQETVVLLKGKKIVENAHGAKCRGKWDLIESFCQRNGVNWRSDQCELKHMTLSMGYRKIKAWQSNDKEEDQSYWTTNSAFRTEKKLPGSFDREIYELMDGKDLTISGSSDPKNSDEQLAAEDEDREEDTVVFEGDLYATGHPTTNMLGAERVKGPVSKNWTEPSCKNGKKRRRKSSGRNEGGSLGKQDPAGVQTDMLVGAVAKLSEVMTKLAGKLDDIASSNDQYFTSADSHRELSISDDDDDDMQINMYVCAFRL
ncbi:hypothetical protein ACFE04_028839 [Oxalis oulophora]